MPKLRTAIGILLFFGAWMLSGCGYHYAQPVHFSPKRCKNPDCEVEYVHSHKNPADATTDEKYRKKLEKLQEERKEAIEEEKERQKALEPFQFEEDKKEEQQMATDVGEEAPDSAKTQKQPEKVKQQDLSNKALQKQEEKAQKLAEKAKKEKEELKEKGESNYRGEPWWRWRQNPKVGEKHHGIRHGDGRRKSDYSHSRKTRGVRSKHYGRWWWPFDWIPFENCFYKWPKRSP